MAKKIIPDPYLRIRKGMKPSRKHDGFLFFILYSIIDNGAWLVLASAGNINRSEDLSIMQYRILDVRLDTGFLTVFFLFVSVFLSLAIYRELLLWGELLL